MHLRGKKWKKCLSLLTCGAMVLPLLQPFMALSVHAKENEDKTLRLYYDEPAEITGIDNTSRDTDSGFEEESLPLGCGYMGANVWGGTETDAIYITENSLANPYAKHAENSGNSNRTGLNLLAKTWIDFGHEESKVRDYQRDLVLDDATAHVNYEYEGVEYSREYFTSYPDKVLAVKLDASKEKSLSFTLRPEAPYLHTEETGIWADMGKTGTVTSEVAESNGKENVGTVTLSGTMEYYQINYEGQYRVIAKGGTMTKSEGENGGELRIENADSAVILLAVGTNYKMTPETFTAPVKEKLDPNEFPHEKVTEYLNEAEKYSYEELRERHVKDYQTYYSRVDLNLGGVDDGKTTDQLLSEYKKGTYSKYLEEVFFQYGRYLLIASSRKGCLPANLQGIWNAYEDTPWSGGYWHNVNVQMNYWPAFVTNMPELFESYADFNAAFREQAEGNADQYLADIGSEKMAEAGIGENGWAVGTGVYPYTAGGPSAGGHSGPGTGGFTTALFWDWYDFTRDQEILENHTYPAVEGMAKFLSKSLIEQDGKLLISPSASPENANNKQTVGCAFDQQMTWESYNMLLKSAEILGKSDEPIVQTAQSEIDLLDPVNVGASGQVKEYREENYYGEFGEYAHRHISQLVGLYPGTSINHNSQAWLDAAEYTLKQRGIGSTGWSIAHRLCAWARVGDGNKSYAEVQELLKKKIMNNLWDTHPPFQIDGNFGATAGIGEMLLQSHEGYIAPLAALPSAWDSGSYKGLLARGNFVVDAAWKDGKAEEFQIHSQSGGLCSVKYAGITDAVVRDAAGNVVGFTAEGQDLIQFDTTAGQTYTITEIPAVKEVTAPTNLKIAGKDGGMELSWNGSKEAESYHVYMAVNDAPNYELTAENITDTHYFMEADKVAETIKETDRVTMRVTAVDASGRESEGVTALLNAPEAPLSVKGYYVSENNLQITISEVKDADGYVVYRQTGEDSWEKLYQTEYTTAYIENAGENDVYAVSAISRGRESAKTIAEISSDGLMDNILLNKPVKLTSGQSIHTSYPLTNVVNGKADPENSSDRVGINGDKKGSWTMEIDLQGSYPLKTLSIVEWKNGENKTRSKNTTVEVLTSGSEWEVVESGFACVWNGTKQIDMKGIEGTKIRLTFDNMGDPAKYASITEIMCSAKLQEQADKTGLFQVLQTLTGMDLDAYVISGQVRTLRTLQAEGIEVLKDSHAKQDAVDELAKQIEEALSEFGSAEAKPNILLNQDVNTSVAAVSNIYPAAALVDGDTGTRFASTDTENKLTVTVNLDHTYKIDTLYIQEFIEKKEGTRGGKTEIEVLTNGEWQKIPQKITLKSERDDADSPQATNEIKLDTPVNADAIRYYFENTNGKKRITIFELQASGSLIPNVEKVETLPDLFAEPGTAFEELLLPETVTVYLDNRTEQEVAVLWNPEDYDENTEGTQILTGTLVTGEYIGNRENLTAVLNVRVGISADERLENVIAKAQAENRDDYTAESWSAVEAALETALAVRDNEDSTDEEKNQAAEALEAALEALQPAVDKSALKEVLDLVKEKQETDYTIGSWKKLIHIRQDAEAIYENESALQTEIDEVKAALQTALEALVYKADLDRCMEDAESREQGLYTEESWNQMIAVLHEAQAILVTEEATQSDIDTVCEKLKAAIEALEEISGPENPDASALQELVKQAEALDKTKYTEASWNVLQNALETARRILEKADALQEEYDEARQNLEHAISALELVKGDDGEAENPGSTGGLGTGNAGNGSGNANQGTDGQKSVKTGDKMQTGEILFAAGLTTLLIAGSSIVLFRKRED